LSESGSPKALDMVNAFYMYLGCDFYYETEVSEKKTH